MGGNRACAHPGAPKISMVEGDMPTIAFSFAQLTDAQLLIEVHSLVARDRQATARVVASLAELETRGLLLADGCSSLFTYCTQRLYLSEAESYSRIAAARAARKWPLILELLADGSITLTTVNLLAAHLTSDNHRTLLDAARHKGRREVEQQVVELRPLAEVPSIVRKLPAPKQVLTTDRSGAECSTPMFVVAAGAGSAGPPPVPIAASAPPDGATAASHSQRRPNLPLAPERATRQFTTSR